MQSNDLAHAGEETTSLEAHVGLKKATAGLKEHTQSYKIDHRFEDEFVGHGRIQILRDQPQVFKTHVGLERATSSLEGATTGTGAQA